VAAETCERLPANAPADAIVPRRLAQERSAVTYESIGRGRAAVEHLPVDLDFAQAALDAIRDAMHALEAHFGLGEDALSVRCILAPDRAEFDRCVRDVLGVEIESPSHLARVGMHQRNDLVLLSPRACDPRFAVYSPDGFKRLVFHEVVHIMEEHLSPDIEAVARWWSEGLAIYLSDQWREPRETQRVLEAIEEGRVPSMAEMGGDSAWGSRAARLPYVWGWTIVMYVEQVHGRDTVRRAVKDCADGDVPRALGVEPDRFECAWRSWLVAAGRDMIAASAQQNRG
jgi:hypothetical protein